VANKASSTSAKFFAGEDIAPATMQMGPEKKKAKVAGGGLNRLRTKNAAELEESKSAAATSGDDVDALKATIADL